MALFRLHSVASYAHSMHKKLNIPYSKITLNLEFKKYFVNVVCVCLLKKMGKCIHVYALLLFVTLCSYHTFFVQGDKISLQHNAKEPLSEQVIPSSGVCYLRFTTYIVCYKLFQGRVALFVYCMFIYFISCLLTNK